MVQLRRPLALSLDSVKDLNQSFQTQSRHLEEQFGTPAICPSCFMLHSFQNLNKVIAIEIRDSDRIKSRQPRAIGFQELRNLRNIVTVPIEDRLPGLVQQGRTPTPTRGDSALMFKSPGRRTVFFDALAGTWHSGDPLTPRGQRSPLSLVEVNVKKIFGVRSEPTPIR